MQKKIQFVLLMAFILITGTLFANTIQCDPTAADRWTGTTDGATITDLSEVRGGGAEDGWFRFDTSGIPAGSTINSVEFHGYVNDTNYPYWAMTPLSCDPLTADAATLFADITAEENSGYYLYQEEDDTYAPGWKVHDLGLQAATDLQAGLAGGWWACGMASTDNWPAYYLNYDGWNEANPPYIIVDYTPAGGLTSATNPNPIDGAGGVPIAGILTWDWGTLNNTYDLWFGPLGAATEVVTGGACIGPSGLYPYAGLTNITVYEWWVVSYDTSMNSATSPHWDFTTVGPTQGGPDTFGYTWMNSADPGGPTYDWVTITAPTAITGMGDDWCSAALPLGINFPFYGAAYNDVHFSSNGFLIFGGTETDYGNDPIPDTNAPDNFIPWFWDDLDPTDGGTAEYGNQNVGGQPAWIVTMENYHEYDWLTGTGNLTCQVILFENGDILKQYQSFDGGIVMDEATVGIENADGTDGLQYEYNQNLLGAGMAIEYAYPLNAPGAAGNPSPVDGAVDVALAGTLTWDWGANNDTYDLWFGPAGAATEVVTGGACTGPSGSYPYTGLTYLTGYEWWVVSYNTAMNSVTSLTWDFTSIQDPALPTAAYDPSPGDVYGNVPVNGSLTWTWGVNNVTYDLWFGEPGAEVQVVTGDPCAAASYAYSGLTEATDYSWWIVVYNAAAVSATTDTWGFDTFDPALATAGGPDTYGHIWLSGYDAGGPAYDWIAPVIRTEILPLPGDDDYVGPFALGFDFDFYGNIYNEFYFGSNGCLSFGAGVDDLSNDDIPNTSTPNNLIAWFWDDLDPEDNPDNDTHIYYETRLVGGENACVVTMENYHEYSGSGTGKLTAQAILFENGDIKLQYQSFEGGIDMDGATVGIENIDGTDGLQYSYNEYNLWAGMAIQFYDPIASPVVFIAMSGDDAVLTWDAVTGAVQYHVYYATDPSGPWTEFGDSPIPGLTYTHTGIGATDVKYFYYVTADDTVR
ncbi:MAG: hypothetical protein K8R90_01230 [Candidatus Cloacimonetes bacterium]|nr:hypothetical protein [Candidatus Cloacimonadota bacterium]